MVEIESYRKDFFNNLRNQIIKFEKEYNDNYEVIKKVYSDSKKWTTLITKGTKSINFNHDSFIDKALMLTFSSQKYKFANEYFLIDNLIYKDINNGYECADMNKYKINKHRWKLLAAVEHENNKKEWTDELIKLLHINCDFRCVISYGDFFNDYEDQKKIANELIKEMNEFGNTANYISDKQEFLLIFGPTLNNVEKVGVDKKISEMFKGFVFDTSKGEFTEFI